MQSASMIRLLRQNLPVYLFGFWQASGLVVLHGQFKGLLDGELGHGGDPAFQSGR